MNVHDASNIRLKEDVDNRSIAILNTWKQIPTRENVITFDVPHITHGHIDLLDLSSENNVINCSPYCAFNGMDLLFIKIVV